MGRQARTETQPVRVYIEDRELNTTRRRNVAWRITCKRCGTSTTGRYPGDALRKLEGHDCDGNA